MNKEENNIGSYIDIKELSSYLEATQDLLVLLNTDGRVKWINPAWEKFLDIKKSEITGRSFFDFVHTEDVNDLRKLLTQLSADDMLFKDDRENHASIEVRLRKREGHYKWILMSISANAGRTAFYCAGQDITQRKQTEEEVRLLRKITEYYNKHIPFSDSMYYTLKEICEYACWDYGQIWLIDMHTKEIQRSVSSLNNSVDMNQRSYREGVPGPAGILSGIGNVPAEIIDGSAKDTEAGEAGRETQTEFMLFDENTMFRQIFPDPADSTEGLPPEGIVTEERLLEFDELNRLYNIVPNNDPVASVLKSRQPLWIEDLAGEKEFLRSSWTKKTGLKSLLIIPVIFDGETVALMEFYSGAHYSMNNNIIRILAAASVQLGMFIARKRTEEALIKNEKLLADTQKITHVGSWEWNLRTNKIYWSAELYRIFGIEPQQHQSYKDLLKIMPVEDAWRTREIIQSAIKNQQPFKIEHKIVRSDGAVREILEKAEIVTDSNGKITKLIGTVQDITAQKDFETALLRNEEYFRALIENALDIKSIVGSDGRFKYVSPSVHKTLGYSQLAIIGLNVMRFIHPGDLRRVKKIFQHVVATPGETVSVEFRIKHRDGSFLNFESIMKNLLDNPAVGGVVINSRDITGRKKAEKTVASLLSISKKLNSTLHMDSLMDLLVEEAVRLTNSRGGFAALRTAEGMISAKYMLDSHTLDFEHSWPLHKGMVAWLMQNKKPFVCNNVEAGNTLFDKTVIDKFSVRSMASIPVTDADNEVIGFLEIHNKTDNGEYTEDDKNLLAAMSQSASSAFQNALAYQKIKTAEYQLKISREQLRRLSAHLQSAREEERTRISREIHDELGQALTGLKMDLSWLTKKMSGDGYYVKDIKEKIAAMGNLIDATIKVVRKISSELRPGVLDYLGISAAIEWQAQEFQSRTGIECRIVSLDKDLEVEQELATAVFRIFQETLTNVTRHANASLVEVSLHELENSIILTTKDNGRGITESEIANTKSLGILGMRERALLLGGDFSISASPLGGTVVTVQIPVNNQNPAGEK